MATNYQRSYRITIGREEVITPSYVVNLGTVFEKPPLKPRTATAVIQAQSIPAGEIIQLSNLPQDGASLRGIMFTFDSVRSSSATASKSERSVLKLYNINDKTLNVLNQEGCKILIEAGYGANVNLIYTGTVDTITPKSQGTDIITTVRLKDIGIDTKNTRISVDFAETMSVADVIEALIDTFPSSAKGPLAIEKFKDKFITGGYSYQGNVIHILERICAQNDLVYSIYNGVITVQENQLVQGTPSYLLAERNLWKFDENTIKTIDASISNKNKLSGQKNIKRGVVLSTFLIPITMSQFFEVSSIISENLAGTYKITSLGIKLNSRQGSWDTTLRGEPL